MHSRSPDGHYAGRDVGGEEVAAGRGPRHLSDFIAALESAGMMRTFLAAGRLPPARLPIGGVVHDSREVRRGSLFVCLPGQHVDGHEFAPDAVRRGAAAVVVERTLPGLGAPQLVVVRSRPALALCAACFEGYPSHELGVVGVTGTDGKTTTSYLVRAMLEACGLRSGMIATTEVVVGGRSLGNPGRATTPEAPEVQHHLAGMRRAGERFAVIEATSHGLAQERVTAVAWDVAVMTNLSHEHLEFHRTYDAYRAAKLQLFQRLAAGAANPHKGWGKAGIVNLDDASSGAFADATREAGARLITYGTASDADVGASRIEERPAGLVARVRTRRWEAPVALRLNGRFNAYNALAAVSVGEALGLDPERMRAGLEGLPGVPGRMERVEAGQPFTVIVDYAHTPESLAKLLDELAPLAAAGGGGLVCVFGSAGERDVLKRPMMGRVAGERCRLVVLTDEDPRGEDRHGILDQIAAGAEKAGRRRGQDLLLVPDREAAIALALEQARPGDVVALCGKGHERTIEIGGAALAWDEPGTARAVLAALGYEGTRAGAAE